MTSERPVSPEIDTPTRAARALRPQTRLWKQLITDATNRSTVSVAQRARLRSHLAAADKLAAKRRALIPASIASKSKKLAEPDNKDPKTVLTKGNIGAKKADENTCAVPLFDEKSDWNVRVSAFEKFAEVPTRETAASAALVLPDALRDLRGKVVVAASKATIAAAPFLDSSALCTVLDAAVAGATVTKRVMADACERAALSLVRGTLDPSVWCQVNVILNDEHVAARRLAVNAVAQLVQDGSPARLDFITEVTTNALRIAAEDKAVEVRDAARGVVAKFRVRFGEQRADTLLTVLPDDVRARFTLPSQGDAMTKNMEPRIAKRKPPSNIRDLIRARKAAIKEMRVDAASIGEKEGDTVHPKVSKENKDPAEDKDNVVVVTFR